jgi:hypothetical protein
MHKTCLLVAVLGLAACAQSDPAIDSRAGGYGGPSAATPADVVVLLTGEVENPPVSTSATGRAFIVVDEDGMVRGVIEAPDMTDPVAVIEDDASDAEAATVVMLVPTGVGRWQVPPQTRLTAMQQAHYRDGKLYANVRSKAHPKGEVRAQLRDKSRARP